jgi:hypothetical protein
MERRRFHTHVGPLYWDGVEITLNPMKPLKLSFMRKDPVLLQVTESIIAGATGNAALANPPVTLANLGTLRTAAADGMVDEAQGLESLQMKRTARRDAVQALRLAVKQYATYAYSMFGGNKQQLQGLGLDVVEVSGLLGILPAPQNVRSKPGQLFGTIDLRWQAVRGRSIYKLECAESAEGPWTVVYEGNRANTTCTDLVSGKEYFFRVHALGTAGPGTLSDITKARAA